MNDLAQLHHDVVFGRSGGRIIWQPRIQCWHADKVFNNEPLPDPYAGMDLPEIYRSLGCSNRCYAWYNPCYRQIDPPQVRRREERLNETDTQTTLETPVGNQVRIDRYTPNSPRTIHVKWPVTTEAELKVATWVAEHTTWEWDQAYFEQSQREVGDLGAPTMFMPRMSIQDLYINTMGAEQAIYALLDWPDTIKAYFRALEISQNRLIDVINASPIDIINMGENLHCGTLPPRYFLEHHLPYCRRVCDRLHAAGKFVSSHWDGDCAPLLRYAKDTGLDGIEAITPQPQGDVTLEQIKDGLGDDLFLLDGIPAVYFDKTFSESTLVDCTQKIIELFAPKLVLGISDELSSNGDIERIRLVGDLVRDYNARLGHHKIV